MRPGKMRHTITLQRVSVAPNAYGTEVETWADVATLRAELVSEEALQSDTAEAGSRGRTAVTFLTRVFGGVTVADRLVWRGAVFGIVAVGGGDWAEGRGLQIKCEGSA